jgi:hypothetical protein
LTSGQSAQYKSCGKYSNLSPCKFLIFQRSLTGPALHRPSPSSRKSPDCLIGTSRKSADCLIGTSIGKFCGQHSPVWRRRPNCLRWADHPSPPRASRMSTCAPAPLSRHVSHGAPWHPVIAAACVCPHWCYASQIPEPAARRRSPRAGRSAGQASAAECVPWRPSARAAHAHA